MVVRLITTVKKTQSCLTSSVCSYWQYLMLMILRFIFRVVLHRFLRLSHEV